MSDRGLIRQRELLGTYQKRIFEINNFWRQAIRFMDYHASDESTVCLLFNTFNHQTVDFTFQCFDYLGNLRTTAFYPHVAQLNPYLHLDFLNFIYPGLAFKPIINQTSFEQFILSLGNKDLYETLIEMKNGDIEDVMRKI